MNTPPSSERTERGQGMVEFALSLTIFIFVFVVIFDLARAVYTGNVLASVAREGARYAILDPTNTVQITAAAKAVAFGINQGNISVTSTCSPPCKAGSDISVEATYQFRPISPLLPAFTEKSVSTMTIE